MTVENVGMIAGLIVEMIDVMIAVLEGMKGMKEMWWTTTVRSPVVRQDLRRCIMNLMNRKTIHPAMTTSHLPVKISHRLVRLNVAHPHTKSNPKITVNCTTRFVISRGSFMNWISVSVR
jgi:hypothetical protein